MPLSWNECNIIRNGHMEGVWRDVTATIGKLVVAFGPRQDKHLGFLLLSRGWVIAWLTVGIDD